MTERIAASESPIRQAAVDGVPVLCVPGGHLTAELVFRVGAADEPLPIRGVSHLIEHLALSTIGQTAYPYNGQVSPLFTSFVVQGTAEQVSAHFAQLCRALVDLPIDRWSDEVRILRIEAETHSRGPVDRALRSRFQLNSTGAVAFDELAFLGKDMPDIHGWARRWFTAQNAMLWVSGDVPELLRLDLPSGMRIMPDEPKHRDITLPAWCRGVPGGVAISMSVPRSVTCGALLQILYRRAMQRLRVDDGIAYDVNIAYTHVSATLAEATVWVATNPDTSATVAKGLNDTIDSLAQRGPSQVEIDELKAMAQIRQDDDAARSMLRGGTERELLGDRHYSPAELIREHEVITVEAVQSIAMAAYASRMLWAPFPESPVPGLTALDDFSHEVYPGRRYSRRFVSTGETLSVGAGGISYRGKKSGVKSIPAESIRVSLAWPNGQRRVFGDGHSMIAVEPDKWLSARKLARDIDAIVPSAVTVLTDGSALPVPQGLTFNKQMLAPFGALITVVLLQSGSRYTSGFIQVLELVVGVVLLGALTLLRAGLPLHLAEWRALISKTAEPMSWPTAGSSGRTRGFPKHPRPRMTVRWWLIIIFTTLVASFVAFAAGIDPHNPAQNNGWLALIGAVVGGGLAVGGWRFLCRKF